MAVQAEQNSEGYTDQELPQTEADHERIQARDDRNIEQIV